MLGRERKRERENVLTFAGGFYHCLALCACVYVRKALAAKERFSPPLPIHDLLLLLAIQIQKKNLISDESARARNASLVGIK